jgi:UDP-glucose 4-epimerase
MRIFITGVAGFLGSHLADAFIARGDQVVGCDSLIGGELDNVPIGVDFYTGDCNDFDRIKRALRSVDVVYHCAATAHEGLSVFSPYENARNGYAASASVFGAACAVGVKRIVFCSSMARYGAITPPFAEDAAPKPQDPYGIGKYAAEMMLRNLCETHGIEWTVAVPHNIYGPRQCYRDPFRNVVSIFANLMLQGRRPYLYGDGLQERCFSYFTDAVEPLVRMAEAPEAVGEIINIGPDGEVVSVLDVARMISEILEVPFDPIFTAGRPREVRFAHCSADKARRLLGFEPKVSLAAGLKETVAWIQKRGPRPFSYHSLAIEIESPQLPETWRKRIF